MKEMLLKDFGNGISVHYQRSLDAKKYKKPIMELVQISRKNDARILVKGTACLFRLDTGDGVLMD